MSPSTIDSEGRRFEGLRGDGPGPERRCLVCRVGDQRVDDAVSDEAAEHQDEEPDDDERDRDGPKCFAAPAPGQVDGQSEEHPAPDREPERDGSKRLDDVLERPELIGLENDDLAGVGRDPVDELPAAPELGANLGEERPDVENDLVPLQRDELALVVDQPVHGLHGRLVRGRPHVQHPRASQDPVDRLDRDSVEAGAIAVESPAAAGGSAPSSCCATASGL